MALQGCDFEQRRRRWRSWRLRTEMVAVGGTPGGRERGWRTEMVAVGSRRPWILSLPYPLVISSPPTGINGTEKIEMIVLNSSMKIMEYKYNTKAFKDMKNLRFLQIDGIHLGGNFKHLPCKALRCLRCNQCPLKYIPSGYFFEKLVKLEMRKSNIKEFGAPLKICLRDWKSLKMLPQLPQKLMSLEAINCESLETVHLPKKLKHVHFDNCIKLKEIQWENAQFLRNIKLRGVPNIKFSETINQVLKVSKLNYKIKFEGYLPRNETLSWIKFEENGSSISFQWPQLISKLELLGICIWVVLPRLERYPHDEYYGRIEKDGFKVWSRRWYSFLDAYSEAELLEEGGYDSFVDFIPQESFEDIKAGKIFKVIPKLINILGVFESFSKFKYVKKGMEHKVRVEVLYRDREDGLLQFLPLTKLDSNTDDEVLYRDREDGVLQFLDDDDDDEEEEGGFLQFLDDDDEEGGFLQFLDDDEEEEEEEGGFLQFLDDDDDEEEEDGFLQFLDDEEEEDGFLQFLDDEEEEEDGFLQFDEEEEDDF
nr:TMV resistance protein N-like [Ipomoea batatas]